MNATKWTRTLMGLALVGLMACGGGEPAEEEVVEEAPPAAPAMPEATVIQATELATNPQAHEGMTVRVNALMVKSPVGNSAVFVDLPTTPAPTPFLVYFLAPPIPAAGRSVDIVGTVKPVTPEVVSGWVTAGTITENDRLVVEFASHYLESQSIQPAGM
jgi:hypothetical protein